MHRSKNSSNQIQTSSNDIRKKVTFKKLASINSFRRLVKRPQKDSTESIARSTDVVSFTNDPSLKISSSEAERFLNFNPVPDESLQEKIDMYITPYNSTKVVTKYMNFNEKEAEQQASFNLGDKWKKISALILNQDKQTLRNTLSNINDKLYKKVNQTLKKCMGTRNGGSKKRVKFASSTRNSPSRRGKSSLNVKQFSHCAQAVKRMSLPMNVLRKEDGRLSPPKPKDSLVSLVIDDIRQNQQYEEDRRNDTSEEAMIIKSFQRSKTMSFRRNNIFNSKETSNGAGTTQLLLKSLNCIPEKASPAKHESTETSVSDFIDNESVSLNKVDSNQDLINKLLKREHHVFKKNSSVKKIPSPEQVDLEELKLPKRISTDFKTPIKSEYYIKISKEREGHAFLDRLTENSCVSSKLLGSLPKPFKCKSTPIQINNTSGQSSGRYMDKSRNLNLSERLKTARGTSRHLPTLDVIVNKKIQKVSRSPSGICDSARVLERSPISPLVSADRTTKCSNLHNRNKKLRARKGSREPLSCTSKRRGSRPLMFTKKMLISYI